MKQHIQSTENIHGQKLRQCQFFAIFAKLGGVDAAPYLYIGLLSTPNK